LDGNLNADSDPLLQNDVNPSESGSATPLITDLSSGIENTLKVELFLFPLAFFQIANFFYHDEDK
jgi:hypothetical protein